MTNRCGVVLCAGVILALACETQAQFWRRQSGGKPELVEITDAPATQAAATVVSPLPEVTAPTSGATGAVAEAAAAAPTAEGSAVAAPVRGELLEKRALYRLRDQETVDALVRLAAGRQLREQELAVVSRLIREKEQELAAFNGRLQEQFGISETGNYHYDNERRVIFELKAKEGEAAAPQEGGDPLAGFDKNPVRRLKDKETEDVFLRLVGAKKITSDQIRALQLILQEKKIELSNIQDSLREQFSMDPAKHYEYDAETRVVHELVYGAPGETAAAAVP